ncbi:ParA family protein [Candidatus Binatia bacterium]|nr:ParA family protein [Candidatus Binatia bacterium]
MGRVICLANQKGGVGKTTTAVNLAACLGLAGHPTLLIDLDPQASASSGVGVSRGENDPSTYDVIIGQRPAAAAIRTSAVAGLAVLPASRDLIGAEIELVPMLAREHRLADALRGVRDQYEFILVDCPPSLGLLTLNGLTAADAVLIPLQCEYYALEGLSAILETVELIRKRLNPSLQIEGLLLTMFDTRNGLCHQVVEEVRRYFPQDVFDTIIPRNVRLSEAPSHGLPTVVYDPTSRGAQAYQMLAREMLAEHGMELNEVPETGPGSESQSDAAVEGG